MNPSKIDKGSTQGAHIILAPNDCNTQCTHKALKKQGSNKYIKTGNMENGDKREISSQL